MTRSRIRERNRQRTPVETSDSAALAANAATLRPVVAQLRTLAEDATVKPAQRVHGRLYLRNHMLRSIRELETRIAIAMHDIATSNE